MGGRCRSTATPGQGSEFRVWLVRSRRAAVDAARGCAVDRTGRPSGTRPLSVLYIEDNPVNALVVQELVAMRPNVAFDVQSTA